MCMFIALRSTRVLKIFSLSSSGFGSIPIATKVGYFSYRAMSALPLTYIVRSANVNDKDVALPQLKRAQHTLNRQGKCVGKVIADRQYYSEDIFKAVGKLKAEVVIPYPSNVKEPMIDLWLNKRFKVKGDSRLVELYKTQNGR